ncbi:MAG: hypothetical protein IKK46_04700 [Clostridia bacterium]|nr:hypothetical protein [Clostridia bacterium]MBR3809586.1 hypothetical protein [Clostridia bacterium]
MKKEKWKLEPIVKKVCLATTIFYGVIITLIGLVYLAIYCSSNGVLENIDLSGTIFTVLLGLYIVLHYTMILYVTPFVIVIFLIGVIFSEVRVKGNSLICIHPLILSSITTSIAGTLLYVNLIENSF